MSDGVRRSARIKQQFRGSCRSHRSRKVQRGRATRRRWRINIKDGSRVEQRTHTGDVPARGGGMETAGGELQARDDAKRNQ